MKGLTLIGIGFCALLMLSVRSVVAEEIDHPTDAAHFNSASGVTLQIGAKRRTPTVTWATPLPIMFGVALDATQLNAKASVPGTFVYSPPSGTVLPPGDNQTLSVNFTPNDEANYRVVNNTHVQITVNPKPNPVITWVNPADISYGVALGSGSFIYSPPTGTVLLSGANQALTANFAPTDGANYNPVITTVYINVSSESLNHPPVLTNIESDPILYELGDKPASITKEVILSDMDDGFMCSARITLMENFKNGDLLTWDGASNKHITSTFNAEKGELVLSGNDSKSNYETALHLVLFSRPISGDTSLSVREVGIVVRDSSHDSNVASRIIRITNQFPELSIVNAFTPNSDKVNDDWDFVNLQFYKEIKIAVFDENGSRVFDCGDKACKWDGKNKGRDLPAGPYFYSINLNGGKRTYRGTVTILK